VYKRQDLSCIGGVDNFCWPTIIYDPVKNPDGKYKAAQLVRACWALRDYTRAFEIPLLSGKDSMYTDGEVKGPSGRSEKISGLPTFQFTTTTVVKDIRKCVTMDVKIPGDIVYILGETRDELGASEYYRMMHWVGVNVPKVDPEKVISLYQALYKAIQNGLIASCHAVGRGGLGVHLALCAIGGNVGMDINLASVPVAKELSNTRLLYSESAGRFIVTIDETKIKAFEDIMGGLNYACVGRVTDADILHVAGVDGSTIVTETIRDLKGAWKEPFGDLI